MIRRLAATRSDPIVDSTPPPSQLPSLPAKAGSENGRKHAPAQVGVRALRRRKGARRAGKAIPLRRGWYLPVKAAAEFVASLVLLALATPVIAFGALAVKFTSRGPAFYTQTRLGKGGRPFRIVKLRTMYHNCERLSGARWAVANDPRVTTVGYF